MPLRFDIVTIFPDFFRGPFSFGVLERALRKEQLHLAVHDLRAYTHDRHRTVDDRPFGGGEGMVLKPEPIFNCLQALALAPRELRDLQRERVLLLSAAGRPFRQAQAHELAKLERVVLLCGRYEGVDERVTELMCDGELSLGDFVLTGGELAAACVVDAVARLLPGVLGHADSHVHESFGPGEPPDGQKDRGPLATHVSGGILDYPHYTRPPEFQGVSVPPELVSGDHAAVRAWRRRAALRRTLLKRPDLLEDAELTDAERRWLEQERDALRGTAMESS